VKASRRNIRKALNRRHGKGRWTKYSTARWNPAGTLSVKGVSRSVMDVFKVKNLYDGLAIGGGIVGALGLPSIIDRFVPAAWKAKLPVSLTGGWFGYVMNAASAGLAGYIAGLVFNKDVARKVFLGGIGATVAKIVLDRIPMVRSWFGGVSLSGFGDYGLQKAVEQEVLAELKAGGAMGAYVTPSQMMAAASLGDYATPGNIMDSVALGAYPGGYDEFGAYPGGYDEFGQYDYDY